MLVDQKCKLKKVPQVEVHLLKLKVPVHHLILISRIKVLQGSPLLKTLQPHPVDALDQKTKTVIRLLVRGVSASQDAMSEQEVAEVNRMVKVEEVPKVLIRNMKKMMKWKMIPEVEMTEQMKTMWSRWRVEIGGNRYLLFKLIVKKKIKNRQVPKKPQPDQKSNTKSIIKVNSLNISPFLKKRDVGAERKISFVMVHIVSLCHRLARSRRCSRSLTLIPVTIAS